MPKFETLKIKKGDNVIVLTGKDAGKQGKVIKLFPKKEKVLVERINLVKKHQKPTQMSQGGIIEKEAPIHVSNVSLYCEKCNRGTRIEYKIFDDNKKVRVCKRCNNEFGA